MLITSRIKAIITSDLHKEIIKPQLVVYVIKESFIVRGWQIILYIYKSPEIFCRINTIASIKAANRIA